MNARTVIRSNPLIVALALLAAVALTFVSEGTYVQTVEFVERLSVSQAERFSLRELHLGVLNAESSQRGYLLTGRKDYLGPYFAAIKEANDSLEELAGYYRGNVQATQTLAELRAVVGAKLAELAQALELYEQGQYGAAQALIMNELGRQHMAHISTLRDRLQDSQSEQRVRGVSALRSVLTLSRIGVTTLSVLGLLALFLYLRQNAIVETHRVELKRVAQTVSDGLEAEVKRRTAQLIELTHHLQTAREDERNRLARNLHDELGALLTAAKLDAARIKSRLGNSAPEAQERLAHLVSTLNSSIALGRGIIEDLRPSTLANLGLVPTLEILLREFGERSNVEVHTALAPARLATSAELAAYRLIQEAVTNISKYARAGRVTVSMAPHNGRVEIVISDDGVGFDTDTALRNVYGLVGMRFRIEAEGGTMTIVSAPGNGTTLRAMLPELAAGAGAGPSQAGT